MSRTPEDYVFQVGDKVRVHVNGNFCNLNGQIVTLTQLRTEGTSDYRYRNRNGECWGHTNTPVHDRFELLGTADGIKVINKVIRQNNNQGDKNMNQVTQQDIKDLALSEDDRLLREAGFTTTEGNRTQNYDQVLFDKLAAQYKDEVVADLKKIVKNSQQKAAK